MTPTPHQRVAIVTGGSGGIGRAIARRLAADGAIVVINFSTHPKRAEEVVAEIATAGGKATAIGADVADENAVADMFDEVDRRFGGLDVAVHAAGQMNLASVLDLDLLALDEMLRTNIRGAFVVNQQAARRIRPGGSILNFSSSVVGMAMPQSAGYSASKAAVETMTRVLAAELRGRDVTVNAIAPGPTATRLFLESNDEQTISHLSEAPPLNRLGTPDDIAHAAVFLTGSAGHWINGQTIRANGGIN